MLVRTLNEGDLEALWALRLRALRDDPEAFGTTYDEAAAGGSDELRRRLRQTSEAGFYLGAFADDLIGLVRFRREEGAKDRHKGEVSSLYVPAERRGQGVGTALMREVIAQAQCMAGLEQLHLAVVTTNAAAVSLYQSLGFAVYGTTPRSLKQGERYWDEQLMVLHLR